jgi:hypothetical protein
MTTTRCRRLPILTLFALALPGCFFAQMKKQQEQCNADVGDMLAVPASPPVQDFSGRWTCIYQGPEGSNNEALDVAQSGSRLTVTMHDGYGSSGVADGEVGGDVIAFRYDSGGAAFRLQGDRSGRLMDGAVRMGAADDCAPRRYTCTRR